MALRYHVVRFAEHLDLAALPIDGLHLLHGSGRGVQVQQPAGWLSLWLPLTGALHLETPGSAWTLESGHAQLWREGRLRCSSHLPCWWLALAGPVAAWSHCLQTLPGHSDSELFPWEGPAPRAVRHLLVWLARQARRDGADNSLIAPRLQALCAALLDQQQELHARLPRCSGRTLRRRQQTMLRLLRVQHLVRRDADSRLDLARLARSASYSPCHLIRIYRDVFDETPSEYAARLRTDRAWRMVRDTAMPVCEITEALGFESQSAFCRAFKQCFGLTATQARRLDHYAAHAA
ncbi:helix-turn-helix domain-containing protein [Lysobacter cavernae]|uniref:Helix-turn-helix domain-containing protein n=1 Tax=Lysobacter cavernae TaxID=1685901 RepID=A0ABV7RTS9_9GAMM